VTCLVIHSRAKLVADSYQESRSEVLRRRTKSAVRTTGALKNKYLTNLPKPATSVSRSRRTSSIACLTSFG